VETIARRRGLDPGDIEIWFGDKVRIGQKNKITRRWARRGQEQTPCKALSWPAAQREAEIVNQSLQSRRPPRERSG
jgi:hypothetical protein